MVIPRVDSLGRMMGIYKTKYLIGDALASAIAWTLFYLYRKAYIEPLKFGYKIEIFNFDTNYFLALFFIPLYWLCLYGLLGTYHDVVRKSRVRELGATTTHTFLGSVILFFGLLLNDVVSNSEVFRLTFIVLLTLQLVIILVSRLGILTDLKGKIKRRELGFNTVIGGTGSRAKTIFNELQGDKNGQGYTMLGYVRLEETLEGNGVSGNVTANGEVLGTWNDFPGIIRDHKVEEVILAPEKPDRLLLDKVLELLESEPVKVKVLPDMYDLVTGSVKLNYIFGSPLVEVMAPPMPAWQKNIKRVIDIAVSFLVLTIGSPLYAILAIAVKRSSPGPVFFKQIRIGFAGQPFQIIKFRSMYIDSEKEGPRLSTEHDPRITRVGRTLRKYRLDEFPQFYNVLIGEMSLVGPRPERQHYINLIMAQAPHYRHLLRVRPGITSWGQVKFGYAENVTQMVERMKFDIIYIENMSLGVDFKILAYTVLTMLQGRGQ